jgi:hypothetical protein
LAAVVIMVLIRHDVEAFLIFSRQAKGVALRLQDFVTAKI